MRHIVRPLRLPSTFRAVSRQHGALRASSTLQHSKDGSPATDHRPQTHHHQQHRPDHDRHIGGRADSDDVVPHLAKQRLHPLSLADLVKYTLPAPSLAGAAVTNQPLLLDTAALRCPPRPSSRRPASRSRCSRSAWRTEFKHCATSPTTSSRTPTSAASTTTTSTRSPPSSLGRAAPSATSKTRSASPRSSPS